MGNPYAPKKKSTKSVKTQEKQEAPQGTPEDQKTQSTAETPVTPEKTAEPVKETVPETTMEGIIDWVGTNKDRAALAIEHEKAQPKPRKTLLAKLKDI